MTGHELLTVEEMSRADQAAIDVGITGLSLMERAGRAVAEAAARIAGRRPILVLCGPGNNGGDGYVAARYLRNRGHTVRLAALGDPDKLNGDASANFKCWQGDTESLSVALLTEDTVIIDALFGAGLARAIEGVAADVLRQASKMNLASIAVDLPSGVNGNTGEALGGEGAVLTASETVTFFRKKPGHLLYPGRGLCGHVTVADIGIPQGVLDQIKPTAFENAPTDWSDHLINSMTPSAHKYTRGHLVIAGGETMTGAARIAATAARRAGAGLVTLAVPPASFPIYASGTPGNLVEARDDFAQSIADQRRNTVLLGPGLGVGDATKDLVLTALKYPDKRVILDADALTSFSDTPDALFSNIQGPVIMTPHDGEFARLFGSIQGDKVSRARQAAKKANAVIVLKGADTVIAAPDGRARINCNAPPWLATAGSGDALAGIISARVANGQDIFDAASAGVWLHGRAAQHIGPGLIAEDLADGLQQALKSIIPT
jgi:hydroxyethylthiazole kinase-like uncharacterized protein yjeF